ncbi:unnamed protein product, partial [marine sediment metagenome]
LSGPIFEDFITILSPQGKEVKKVSLLKSFLNSDYRSVLINMDIEKYEGDVFHTNTVKVLDGRVADKVPMFKKEHVLISMRSLHTIAVVDLDKEKVTWALSGMWKAQHEPTVLENGNLLLFDNLGNHGKSKVIEFNPLTQDIVWAYRGDSINNFYTLSCGLNQRLPNGNTLITESESGRAFEVTPENEIVWEFFNPHRPNANTPVSEGSCIATLFKLIRIDPDQLSFLNELSHD